MSGMISFADPRWLWGLLLLVPLLLLEWRAERRAEDRLRRLVGARPEHALLLQRRPGDRRLGALLRAGAFALLVLGAAGPEWGRELVRRNSTGSDVVLTIDVSASMDVRDVAPSRLEEARREALAVLDRLQGSRIGIVAFAGDAVRLVPLTLDRSAARLVLESISTGVVSEPGTDVGRGLRAAAKMLPGKRRGEQAIVLWTDGEDLESGAGGAADELARQGLRVFAVGVGTPAGDVVPVLDDQGRAVDFKRDEAGGPHRSRLDENLLRSLARKTRGGYFAAARPGGELPRLLGALGGVARGDRGERLVERPVARFTGLAILAAALLAFDLGRRHRRVSSAAKPAKTAPAAAAAALLLAVAAALLLAPIPARAQSAWARGDRAFREGRFGAAESLYTRRAGKDGPPEVRVNRAVARARAGKTAEAEGELRDLKPTPSRTGQTAAYDLGTLLAGRGEFDGALEALREALVRDPNDDDARYNYEWALRRREQERKNPSASQNPQKNPNQAPQPTPSQPQQQQPQPQQGAPQPQPQAPPQQTPPQRGQRMDKQQAERLLGSLEELERLEQQRLRQVRVTRDRKGRDW